MTLNNSQPIEFMRSLPFESTPAPRIGHEVAASALDGLICRVQRLLEACRQPPLTASEPDYLSVGHIPAW